MMNVRQGPKIVIILADIIKANYFANLNPLIFLALFCGTACLSWFLQFQNKLKTNVLTQEEINDGWTSENRSRFGYSYYLVALAMLLFFLNILIVSLALKRPRLRGKNRSSANKNPEGVIMLY